MDTFDGQHLILYSDRPADRCSIIYGLLLVIFVLLCGTSGDLHEMISLDMLFSTSILVALGDVLINHVNRGSEPTRN